MNDSSIIKIDKILDKILEEISEIKKDIKVMSDRTAILENILLCKNCNDSFVYLKNKEMCKFCMKKG